MKPIKTKTCNAVYTLEGCNDLPATQYVTENTNQPGVETCWELSPDELEQVKKTGKVFLYIQGNAVPPVLLTTESCIVTGGESDEK